MLFSIRSHPVGYRAARRVGAAGATFLLLGACAASAATLASATALAGCKKDEATKESITTTTAALHGARLAPAQGELATLLPAEAAKARAANLKPFVELRADWCGPCKQLEGSMKDARMVDAFAGTYLITLDVDEWKAGQLGSMGLMSSEIPVFFELDDKGKATGRKITGGAWADNIPANMAPPLKKFFSGS